MKIIKTFPRRPCATRSCNAATVAVLALLSGSSAFAATGSSVSVAQVTRLDPGDAVIGALPMNQPMHIEVALKPRNKDALDAFVANIASSDAHHRRPQLMTPEQFLADHAPTLAQAQGVVDYLARMGFTRVVIAPNRLLVSADGTAAMARNAFMTRFVQVRTGEGRIAFANTDEARIPATLSDTVLSVVGLQDVHRFGDELHPAASTAIPSSSPPSVQRHAATDYPWIYGATDPVTTTVPIGLLTEGDLTSTQTFLDAYAADNGMKPIAQSVVDTNGTSTDTSYASQWLGASGVLVAMLNGGPGANTGPAASLIFYNIPSLSDADVTADLNTIVSADQARIIEASVAECEIDAQADGTAAAQEAILEAGFAQGQTFAVTTGDFSGPFYPSLDCSGGWEPLGWPASSQYVVAVAGTNLNTLKTNNLKYNFESAWNLSSGKASNFEPKPPWQVAFGIPYTTRGAPDVAFAANQGAVFSPESESTSADNMATSLFAGIWARILSVWGTGSGPAGPILYALPASDFHDIQSGRDFDGQTAGPGYDLATGRGSMIIANAIADAGPLVNKPPTTSFKITEPASKTLHFQSNSSDPDGTVVAHYWDFGDGQTSTLTNPTHVYATVGTYTITETVTDNDGATGSDTQTASTIAQVLGNTGFESGSLSPWKFSATGSGTVVLDNNAADANSGSYSADITYGGGTYLYQTVTIPAGMASATLTVHLHVVDNESPFHSNDLAVQLRQPGGASIGMDAVLATLGSFSNLDASGGYVTETFDVTPYIGQQVIVTFQGVKDFDKNPVSGQFAIDDVTLTAQ